MNIKGNPMGRFVVFVVLFFCSCNTNLENSFMENKNYLEELNWLDGFWIDTTTFSSMSTPKKPFEYWKWYEDSIVGLGGTINELDTLVTENILIKQIDTSLIYIVRVKGKSMLSYNMDYNQADSISFENKAHDFPSKISYKKQSKTLLNYLQGVSYEMERKLKFSYVKVDL